MDNCGASRPRSGLLGIGGTVVTILLSERNKRIAAHQQLLRDKAEELLAALESNELYLDELRSSIFSENRVQPKTEPRLRVRTLMTLYFPASTAAWNGYNLAVLHLKKFLIPLSTPHLSPQTSTDTRSSTRWCFKRRKR